MANNILEAALKYAAGGWCAVPLKPGGKVPYIKGWQDGASTDEAHIREWFKRPSDNIGIVTGSKSGVFAIDCDEKDGKHGNQLFVELCQQHGTPEALNTLTQITPSGGRHYIYKSPVGIVIRNSASKRLGEGIDVRGDGGQIAVAPSRLSDGRQYKWQGKVPVLEAPSWLLELVREQEYTPPAERQSLNLPTASTGSHVDAYVQKAIESECYRVLNAPSGEQNETLFKAAANLGELVAGGVLPESEARAALERAGSAYASKDGQKALLDTINSGIAKGKTHPRGVPDRPKDKGKSTSSGSQKTYDIQTAFFENSNFNVAGSTATDIGTRFGLSPETLNRYRVGVQPEWRHPDASNTTPATARLIVPTSERSYRAVLLDDPTQVETYGKTCVFNADALSKSERPVFVTLSDVDALSLIEVGFVAVAVGVPREVSAIVQAIKDAGPIVPVILAMPNTDDGEWLGQELEARLNDLGLKDLFVCRRNLAGGEATVNRALLVCGKDILQELATSVEQGVVDLWSQEYMATVCALPYMDTFASNVNKSRPAVSTGFKTIDGILGDGLFSGLYVLGGMSSNGKTTLAWQIVDQIAERGHDVLIYTLEQSRDELIAKALSRYTMDSCYAMGESKSVAKSMRGILDGRRWANYTQREQEIIDRAFVRFKEHAGRVFMVEGNGEVSAAHIRKGVERHIAYRRTRPVVFVDYLQVMQPMNDKMTDKQAVDRNVSDLRRISRDFDVPVLVISSLNRQSYDEAVNMSSFKESGNIEYSADVVIGLDLEGMDKVEGKSDEKRKERKELIEQAKSGDSRRIELTVLKNRNGKAYEKCVLEFWPLFNLFKENTSTDFEAF